MKKVAIENENRLIEFKESIMHAQERSQVLEARIHEMEIMLTDSEDRVHETTECMKNILDELKSTEEALKETKDQLLYFQKLSKSRNEGKLSLIEKNELIEINEEHSDDAIKRLKITEAQCLREFLEMSSQGLLYTYFDISDKFIVIIFNYLF